MTDLLSKPALLLLRRMDPERAHRLGLRALAAGLGPRHDVRRDDPRLSVTALGQHFANPFGLAAGFDKDATALRGLMRVGFGFVEVGTVTPRPQSGNPKPRLFRLQESGAVINRMGFNNAGVDAAVARLRALSARPVPVGVNIGINKEGADPERDYPALAAKVASVADYVVVNVSSPNTPGLRDLQAATRLDAILGAILCATEGEARRPPLLVKLAPDLDDAALTDLVEAAASRGIAGLIVSNTTLTRPGEAASDPRASEAGGLSGRPLFSLSTRVLARVSVAARGRLLLVGCGGIASGADALTKIRAGASLLQVYTAFAYEGPSVLRRLKAELLDAMQMAGIARLSDAVGTDAARLAATEATAA
jgi:dihydroorotate dehydrogenase